jgi:hypothetical protein
MKRKAKQSRRPARKALKKIPKLKPLPVIAESPLMAEVHSALAQLQRLWNKLLDQL